MQLGDVIDARDETMGAWFEAKIVKITRKPIEQLKQRSDSVNNTGPSHAASADENTVDDGNAAATNNQNHVGSDESDDGYLYGIVFER